MYNICNKNRKGHVVQKLLKSGIQLRAEKAIISPPSLVLVLVMIALRIGVSLNNNKPSLGDCATRVIAFSSTLIEETLFAFVLISTLYQHSRYSVDRICVFNQDFHNAACTVAVQWPSGSPNSLRCLGGHIHTLLNQRLQGLSVM